MMKESAISYDFVHHQQQSQSPHQQQHSWNHQRQQQLQTHTTSIYSNHQHLHQSGQQNSHSRLPQHHGQQHETQTGQYSQQQIQSAVAAANVAAHHTATNNAAAYYQQATHLYPTYHGQQDQQQQQQQQQQDHHSHHHSTTSVSTSNNAANSVLNAVVVAAAQHAAGGTPAGGSINHHTGWSPGVGPLTGNTQAAHHAVVTDHSTLAYIAHAYQSHGASAVNEHHRNSSGPLGSQPIGSAAHAPTYTVDTLYSSPAAAAAAAAVYGYNNYNAAFFQTSNNGPHAPAHPSPANLSTFWNQTTQHQQQQRTTHSQTLSNQSTTSLQQRQQQLSSDQTNSYLHDPRLFAYGRPQYAHNSSQNFGLHHHQNDIQLQQPQQTQQQPHQHHRMSANLSQQHTLIHQADQSQQNINNSLSQQSNHHNAPSSALQQASLASGLQHGQHNIDLDSRKMQAALGLTQQPAAQKQQNDTETNKNKLEIEQRSINQKSNLGSQHLIKDDGDSRKNLNNKDHNKSSTNHGPNNNIASPNSKSQTVMKSDPITGQYQARKTNTINSNNQSNEQQTSQATRAIYRAPQEDRAKSQVLDVQTKKIANEPRGGATDIGTNKINQAISNQSQGSNDLQSSLEDNMATLAIGPRKTTWASIASQPAKVSQPKSLKSKITGSNSVLSSTNKHLTTSVTIDSSSLDIKNGINPAIKSSVSTAATTTPRGSLPPPIAKVTSAAVASLKLDLLGEDGTDSKISWPAVNASINLTLEDTLPTKSNNVNIENSHTNDGLRREDVKGRDFGRDSRDHNHNQGPNSKFNNSYRDDRRQDDWHRREPREFRSRRDSDRRGGDDLARRVPPHDQHEDLRDHLNARRELKQSGRGGSGQPRQQEDPHYREFKRDGPINNRKDHRPPENFRFSNRGGPDHPRDAQHNNKGQQSSDNGPHHHYNNLRDGNNLRGQHGGKLDLNINPHLNPENFNPKIFDCEPENARFFIIKSYSEDDIHRSIKYSVWCSTNHGNKRLDEAYRQQLARKGQMFLFFSVNGSGHFCGMAQMTSVVDFESSSGIWSQNKWQGEFQVKWIYVKDVPNPALRHITLENNEDKPVTNSRDTQEVPYEKGKAVLKIIHQYDHQTSLFDDFLHYEKRQEEEKVKKSLHLDHHSQGPPPGRDHDRDRVGGTGGRFGRPFMSARAHNDIMNRDRPARYA